MYLLSLLLPYKNNYLMSRNQFQFWIRFLQKARFNWALVVKNRFVTSHVSTSSQWRYLAAPPFAESSNRWKHLGPVCRIYIQWRPLSLLLSLASISANACSRLLVLTWYSDVVLKQDRRTNTLAIFIVWLIWTQRNDIGSSRDKARHRTRFSSDL